MGNNLVTANAGKRGAKESDERYTPPAFMERVDLFFGGLGAWFDPCPASHGEDLRFDGLALDWTGRRLFINPPFSYVLPWAIKLLTTPCVEGVFLCPGNTDSGWHQMLQAELLCVQMKTRIAFVFPDGLPRKSPPMGCHIFYRGHQPDRFADHFGDLGLIVQASPYDARRRALYRAQYALTHAIGA